MYLYHRKRAELPGENSINVLGSLNTMVYFSARQQPERSGAHEANEGGRISHLQLERYLY
jgi:hypothetical protein